MEIRFVYISRILPGLLQIIHLTCSDRQNDEPSRVTSYLQDGDEIRPSINIHRQTYNKDVNRVWVLQKETGVWALVFHSLSIEDSPRCRHDYLGIREVYVGPNTTHYSNIQRYCGNTIPRPYISQHSHVEVRFVTDSLWELKGFRITAIHALNIESLELKLRNYSVSIKSPTPNQTPETTKSKQQGTIFYILIASAAAALIIFGTLLTYFIITMRKLNDNEDRESDLYFIPRNQSSDTKNSNHVILKNSKKQKRKQFTVCENSGKRYTRGKLSTITPPVCRTIKGQTNGKDARSHHNNLYVSNFQFTTN